MPKRGEVSLSPFHQHQVPYERHFQICRAGSGTDFAYSGESGKKGAIAIGQLADIAVLTEDYFSVSEEQIKGIESVLTVVDGKIVYGAGEFGNFGPPSLPVLPEWSPIKVYGGYGAPLDIRKAARAGIPISEHSAGCLSRGCSHSAHQLLGRAKAAAHRYGEFWGLGCDCFAF